MIGRNKVWTAIKMVMKTILHWFTWYCNIIPGKIANGNISTDIAISYLGKYELAIFHLILQYLEREKGTGPTLLYSGSLLSSHPHTQLRWHQLSYSAAIAHDISISYLLILQYQEQNCCNTGDIAPNIGISSLQADRNQFRWWFEHNKGNVTLGAGHCQDWCYQDAEVDFFSCFC